MSYNSIRKYSYPKKCGAKVQHLIHISEVFPAYLLFIAIITYFGGWRQRKIEMKKRGEGNGKQMEIEMKKRGCRSTPSFYIMLLINSFICCFSKLR